MQGAARQKPVHSWHHLSSIYSVSRMLPPSHSPGFRSSLLRFIFLKNTGNNKCRAHGLQIARISCGEINVRSRAYPLNTSDLWRFWRTFLEFCCGTYVFRYQRLLRDLHCCCLDPAVSLGIPVVSSWLGACLFLRPWVYLPGWKALRVQQG